MLDFSLHLATTQTELPTENEFLEWVNAVILAEDDEAEIAIQIVDEAESAELNQRYRDKKGPTNVLSFTLDQNPLVGDIVICAPIVRQEAKDHGIEEKAHWAHLTVHACYHLLGHDHQNSQEAERMEALEIATLKKLGYQNPYGEKLHD
jgi:probable rRNA maturation factor